MTQDASDYSSAWFTLECADIYIYILYIYCIYIYIWSYMCIISGKIFDYFTCKKQSCSSVMASSNLVPLPSDWPCEETIAVEAVGCRYGFMVHNRVTKGLPNKGLWIYIYIYTVYIYIYIYIYILSIYTHRSAQNINEVSYHPPQLAYKKISLDLPKKGEN